MQTISKFSGEHDAKTAAAKANLALVYCNQGRWDEAAELEMQVMEVRVKALGAHHRLTLIAMVNLASSFRKQGRFSDAEELSARVKQTKSNSCSEKA